MIGVYRRADLPAFEQRPVALALWHVADPGNIGTLVRSADAFRAAIGLSQGCGDPTGPKALRASAGAIFRVPLGRFDEPQGQRVALVARAGVLLAELEPAERTVFVLGAERDGLPGDVVAACDAVASIPVAESAESLNVAVAGAIALYERKRGA